MNALTIVAYTLTLGFCALGVYALHQNSYSLQNRLFATVCGLMALANGMHVLFYEAQTPESAMQLYRVAHVFVVLTPPVLALYLLRLAERADLTRRVALQLALWGPAVAFIALFLVFDIGFPYRRFVLTVRGWVGIHAAHPVSIAYTVFALGVMLIPALILSRSTQHRNRTITRYAHVVFVTLVLVGFAATTLEYVALGVPPMFPVALSPAAVVIWVVVVKYRVLRVSLQTAADVVLGNLNVAAIVLDERFRIRDLNPAGERLLNILGSQAHGTSIESFIIPPHQDAFIEQLRTQTRNSDVPPAEFQLMRSDMCFPVMCSSAILLSNRDDVIGYACLLSDIRERRAIEMSLESALRRADRTNQAKSEFIASLSHEIRTPLNAILGSTDLLLEADSTDPSSVGEHLRTVRAATDAALEIVNDILDLAKIEAGRAELREEAFDLSEVLGNIEQVFRPQSEAKGIAFTIETAEEVPRMVVGDRTRVRQILYNLVSNAVKYTAHGSVTVSVTRSSHDESQLVCFAVRDTGIGIPSKSISTLFTPFFQVEGRHGVGGVGPGRTSSSGHQGTGLGLSITRGLVTRMGGRIQVNSEENRGSEFRVSIPLPAAPEAEHAQREPGELRGGVRVLLVEDDRLNRRVVARQLESLGCIVETAADGREVVDRDDLARFEIVLMDLQMPQLGGLETVRRLSEQGGVLPPVVALSGAGLEQDVRDAMAAGMVDYVTKPITSATLKETIIRWAAGGAAGE